MTFDGSYWFLQSHFIAAACNDIAKFCNAEFL